ncbi:LADA_0F05886g1_1 [Lachancea dasiensis]|uniref:LADA_0F05886g1_1 n=1 Tax=Lachancea dasiensis TaxID=1072105 RepID=A0A1G4JK44_9SACH|nr:LADA_0F05886g1_1 [Lachancea dasiensis]
MEHTRTQTNTPPAEAVALHQDPRRGSRGPSDPKAMNSGGKTSASQAGSGSTRQTSSAAVVNVKPQGSGKEMECDYVGDVRASSDHGSITPSQQVDIDDSSSQRSGDESGSTSSQLQTSRYGDQNQLVQEPQAFAPAHTLFPAATDAIFKPFDDKVGRFLASTGKANPPATSLEPKSTLSHADNDSESAGCREVDLRALASFKATSNKSNKCRSHSLPSILHSSLRTMGLSNNSGFLNAQRLQQDNLDHQQQSNQQHGLPPCHQQTGLHMNRGIKKKKQSKHSASLRHALLLNQRIHSTNNNLSVRDRIKYMESYPGPTPLPPINLQCLKEIDLQEIVKNPQLRHDILFDPLLQFRPNLDGERGLKKKQVSDKYWYDVENEIIVYKSNPEVFRFDQTRLVPLFNSLKEVLITIVPQKEVHTVENVLDTELLVQELLKGSLMMSKFSDWLAQLFKHHCAPMRDPWVDKMSQKFRESEEEKSVPKLVAGLRLVFQILEAMKLDIANHQIRILRPALLSNAVEFEKQYFQSLMSSNRVNLKSSFKWFSSKCAEYEKSLASPSERLQASDVYRLCIRSIVSLLSCRKMVREYPTSLSFDHARLILLRADIRQIVCLLVCRLLFKQLVANDSSLEKATKDHIINSYTNKKLKDEIVSIITDEHGNCRWTKNTMSIAIHFCKTIAELKQDFLLQKNFGDVNLANTSSCPSSVIQGPSLNNAQIDFAKSWLSKQTQPLSEVYGVLEARVLQQLENSIFSRSSCTQDGTIKQDFVHLCSTINANASASSFASSANRGMQVKSANQAPSSSDQAAFDQQAGASRSTGLASLDMEEFESLFCHLYTLVNFHWSVFGCLYMDYLGDKMEEVH